MRKLRYCSFFLIFVFAFSFLFESCSPVAKQRRHKRKFKRLIRQRRSSTIKKRHRSPYQRQLKRRSAQINTNYVVKNKRNYRSRPWYNM